MTQLGLVKVFVLLCVCAACGAAGDAQAARTVRTAQGPVRGYRRAGDPVYRFYGIPYATAPTGTRRFTAPLPGPTWIQPLEAIRDSIICPQAKSRRFNTSHYEMREDCLLANVFVPDTGETKLPVVVYVHGGAYNIGFGEFIPPIVLVRSKRIVAVTFNYRLGAHGFLCLGTELAPGNAGMKDQVALLRWVQQNIANFGGNPDDVTVAGYSAGSSSVDLLMLSKMSNGLYHKAMLESGASLATWSMQLDPVQNAKDFARRRNLTNVDDVDALGHWYATSPFEKLYIDSYLGSVNGLVTFTPCVEQNIGIEQFLDDAPVNILVQGNYKKVPMLYGFSNMEGLSQGPLFDEWKNKMNEQFSDFLPGDLQFETYKEKHKIAKVVKQFYFGDNPVSDETAQGFIDYLSDITVCPFLRSVKLHVEAASDSIYLYQYTFANPVPRSYPEGLKNIKGAIHCAQTEAALDYNILLPDMIKTEEYRNMQKILVELWLNFITTGKPVPEGSRFPAWPPVGAERTPYMDLNLNLTLKGRLLEHQFRFWEAIYDQYYRVPVAPQPLTSKVRSDL